MNEVVDFWPDITPEKVRSPKAILKEQAVLLGRKTNNILKGDVTSFQDQGYITIHLQIVAPYLGNYKFNLMSIAYDHVKFYPVRIIADGQKWEDSLTKYEVNSESEFENSLREILSSPYTEKIVKSLYSQSLEETENV